MNPAEPIGIEDLLRRHGAVFADVLGTQRALHHGDPDDEYRALTEGCGLVVRRWASRLELSGADRKRFLNAMMTCDVQSLEAGQGAYGFFTSAKGRILSDAVVRVGEERLVLELPEARAAEVRDHLIRYVVADRVEIAAPEAQVLVDLAGPRVADWLAGRQEAPLPVERWSHRQVELWGVGLRLMATGRFGADVYSTWTDLQGLARLLRESGTSEGATGLRPIGFEAWNTVRVERGAVLFDRDFDAGNLPQETGLEEAVSYTKGCYLGQEIVARLHYRGQAPRGPRGILMAGEALPPPGAEIRFEERIVGALTSVVRSPARGAVFGLALLHRRAWEPGAQVQVVGGGSGVVVDLGAAID